MLDATSSSRTLQERLDSAAEAWRPEQGDSLCGTVIDIDSRTTEYGTYPIVTLETEAGDEVAVHAFHTVLKNEFAKRQPRVGEKLGIKYLGKNEKGGYEAYRLVWGETVTPDWAQIAAEARTEAAIASTLQDIADSNKSDFSGEPGARPLFSDEA